jgi:hypothetical protein
MKAPRSRRFCEAVRASLVDLTTAHHLSNTCVLFREPLCRARMMALMGCIDVLAVGFGIPGGDSISPPPLEIYDGTVGGASLLLSLVRWSVL